MSDRGDRNGDVRMHVRSPSRSPPRRERSRSRTPDDRRSSRNDRDRSRSPRRSSNPPVDNEDPNPGNNLFVSGLSIKTRDSDLEELFGKFGKVQKCNIMVDPHTKESRGFGFICMETVEDADNAIMEINGHELHGRRIVVEKAKRGRARPSTPGTYYGPIKRRPDYLPPPIGWPLPDLRYGDRFDPRLDRIDPRDMLRMPRDLRGPGFYPPPDRGYYDRPSYDRAYPDSRYDRRDDRRDDRDRDRYERRGYESRRDSSYRSARPY